MTLTRQQAEAIRKDIEAAATAVFARHGLVMDRRGSRATYGEDITVRLTASPPPTVGEDGVAMTREARDYAKHATYYGLPADGLGKTFTGTGGAFRIVGLNLKARGRPVMAERVADGKLYVFGTDQVVGALARGAAVVAK